LHNNRIVRWQVQEEQFSISMALPLKGPDGDTGEFGGG